MKKKTLLIIISIMLMAVAAKPQMWLTQNVNPVDEGYNFVCLSVVDSNTVLGIGTYGDSTAFQVGNNFISRSLDGGNNWNSIVIDTSLHVSTFQALSTDTAWMSTCRRGAVLTGINYQTAIWKTTDGGQTWVKNTSIPFDSTSYCDFIHFFNSNEGVAFGDVNHGSWEIYYTTDGGVLWQPADSVPLVATGDAVHDNTQYVVGNNIWATSTTGRAFCSPDKGHNWFVYPVANFQFPNMFRVAFFNTLEGIAVRYNFNNSITSYIYRTHNGGKDWTLLPHTGHVYLSYPFGALFVVPGSNIVISNGGGSTHYGCSFSSDSGATWTAIDSTLKYGVLDGKGWNSLWAGQYSNTLGVGGIAKWDGSFLGIKELALKNDFIVYPNPCYGKLNVISFANISELEITNILGQTIYKANPEANNFSLQLDHTGIYFIRATVDKQTITKKMIVCR
jgi:photosystem II stability/assembly factor-like uncharacterized protein